MWGAGGGASQLESKLVCMKEIDTGKGEAIFNMSLHLQGSAEKNERQFGGGNVAIIFWEL